MGLQSSPGGIDQVAQERRVKANKKKTILQFIRSFSLTSLGGKCSLSLNMNRAYSPRKSLPG